MKIMYVEWMDATSQSGWDKFNRTDVGIIKCQSIGYVVKQDKKEIILAASISEDECNNVISIPTSWIIRKKLVTVNGKKTQKTR